MFLFTYLFTVYSVRGLTKLNTKPYGEDHHVAHRWIA